MKYDHLHIRNFSIIAHIDHGKSTLSDRLIQLSGIIEDRDMKEQILDSMDIERERGITIKSQTVSLPYTAPDGSKFLLNLIDTPGHVDFSYEVSRALASCEGALILTDASQGVEAQTLANLYLAMEHGLEVLPIINKIDLPSAEIEWVKNQIDEDLGLDSEQALLVSAKVGTGVDKVFQAIVDRIPGPTVENTGAFKALIFDSHYDAFRGVIIHVRIFEGNIKKGDGYNLCPIMRRIRSKKWGCSRSSIIPRKALKQGRLGILLQG
ncbi:MAG: GTP-binding protein LepA [Thermodesulfobacteriota bacterium]|nr:GTP-binding protein LepA [Thermodesulfobacteriota bacterium]